jgi:hypothetical protein
VTIMLSLIELPARMSRVDDLLWRDGPETPGLSRSGEPVPYIRWARRAAMLLFLLFVFIVALTGIGDDTDTQAGGVSEPSSPTVTVTAPTTTPPTSVTPTTTAPSTTTTTTSSDSVSSLNSVDNSCYTPDGQGGPQQIPMKDEPSTMDFGPGNLKVCYNSTWQDWGAFATTPPPTKVQLTAWVAVEGAPYGYGQVVDPNTGDSYIIRTSDFKVS